MGGISGLHPKTTAGKVLRRKPVVILGMARQCDEGVYK